MRNFYRFLYIAFASVFLITIQLYSQDQDIDVIYLKNGKTVSGKIVERIPDKTVVIETKDGIEFVDFVDIKKIQKEFIPKIESITPYSGLPGSTLSINGSFPETQPNNAAVLFGNNQAEILQWGKSKINIRVPEIDPRDYVITMQIGNQKDVARIAYTVSSEVQRNRIQKRPVQQQIVSQEEEYDLGGFWMNIAYTMPLGDIAKTDNSNSGFATKGFGIGYEGRIHLSSNFYLPLNFHVAYLGFDTDELQKRFPFTVSSDGKSYGLISCTIGLGLAINLSTDAYLFASADIGPTMVHRPDIILGSSVTYNSANTFTTGHGFSGGITFVDAVTMGYRFFTAKPKHQVEISYSPSSTPSSTVEIEQQIDIGQIYFAVTL